MVKSTAMPLVKCPACNFSFEPREDGKCPQCGGDVREFESDDPVERVRERAKTIRLPRTTPPEEK
jgi:transcription initiation factor IIE alpha subunit